MLCKLFILHSTPFLSRVRHVSLRYEGIKIEQNQALRVAITFPQCFRPLAIKKVSDERSREAFGLRSTTRLKWRLKLSTTWEKPLP
jgi:hypothetical protein